MKFKVKLFVVLILVVNLVHISGQTNLKTEKALEEAQKLYDDGFSEQIPDVLKPFIEEGFSKAQKLKAYHMLIKAYLFDDLQQEANTTLNNLLVEFPEFKVKPEDPKELEYLYKQYNVVNYFSFGAISGLNISMPSSELSYSGNGSTGSKTTVSSIGMQIGGIVELPIMKNINLVSGIIYKTNTYGFEQPLENGSVTTYDESVNQLMLPIWIKPYFDLKNEHQVYLNISGAIGLPLSADADLSLGTQSSSFDIVGKRTAMMTYVGGGLGFSYKIPRGFLSIEGNYFLGLGNVVEPDNRNLITEMESEYSYLDDDFTLNNIMFSISYRYLLYKIKK